MESDRRSPTPLRDELQVPSPNRRAAVNAAPKAHISAESRTATPGSNDHPPTGSPSVGTAVDTALETSSSGSGSAPDLVNFPGAVAAQLGEDGTPEQMFTALELKYREWLVATVKVRIKEDNDYNIEAAIAQVTVESKHKLSPLDEHYRKLIIEYVVEHIIPEEAKTRPASPPTKPRRRGKGRPKGITNAAKTQTATGTSGQDVSATHIDDKEVEEAHARYRAAVRISGYLNEMTVRDDIPASRPEDFMDIRPFTPNEVVKALSITIWEFEEERMRDYVRRPFQTEKPKRTEDEEQAVRHKQPKQTSHPTNQELRDHETYKQDEHGRWWVVFRRDIQLPDGRTGVYEQMDRLPVYNVDAPALDLLDTEKDTYLPGHGGVIVPNSWIDEGTWQRIDTNLTLGGVYRRVYPSGTTKTTSNKRKLSHTAQPTFVTRSFHRQTDGYVKQFRMGKSWEAFDKLVMDFDMNKPQCVEDYNAWIRSIQDHQDYRYYRRPVREVYTEPEMDALRNHFRELFSTIGLVEASRGPQWDELLRKVNDAAAAGGHNVVRVREGVSTKAERNIYANDVPYLGIFEWRDFGRRLYQLQKDNAGFQIPENVLKPRDPILGSDIQNTEDDEEETTPGHKKIPILKKHETRVPKLAISIVERKLIIADRFDGVLVKRHGLMDHAPELGASNPGKTGLVASEVPQDDSTLDTGEVATDQVMQDVEQVEVVPTEASTISISSTSEPVGDTHSTNQSPEFEKEHEKPEANEDNEAWEDMEDDGSVDATEPTRKKRRLNPQ